MRADDRGREDAERAEARVPCGPQHAGHRVGARSQDRHQPALDRGAAHLELRFDQQDEVGLRRRRRRVRRENVRQRDERQVPGDDRGRHIHATRGGERLRGHVPDVEALDGDDSRVGGHGRGELAVTDIDRDHGLRTPLAQHLRESPGRRTHVEGDTAGDVDTEGVETGDELVRGPADVVVG